MWTVSYRHRGVSTRCHELNRCTRLDVRAFRLGLEAGIRFFYGTKGQVGASRLRRGDGIVGRGDVREVVFKCCVVCRTRTRQYQFNVKPHDGFRLALSLRRRAMYLGIGTRVTCTVTVALQTCVFLILQAIGNRGQALVCAYYGMVS